MCEFAESVTPFRQVIDCKRSPWCPKNLHSLREAEMLNKETKNSSNDSCHQLSFFFSCVNLVCSILPHIRNSRNIGQTENIHIHTLVTIIKKPEKTNETQINWRETQKRNRRDVEPLRFNLRFLQMEISPTKFYLIYTAFPSRTPFLFQSFCFFWLWCIYVFFSSMLANFSMWHPKLNNKKIETKLNVIRRTMKLFRVWIISDWHDSFWLLVLYTFCCNCSFRTQCFWFNSHCSLNFFFGVLLFTI